MIKQCAALLTATLLLLSALPAAADSSETLRFQVYMNERPIGEHTFRIHRGGEVKRVLSSAAFDIDFLFINAYRYRHSSNEVFRDGCLEEIRATTNDNGKKYQVEGLSAGKRMRIEHQDGAEQANGCLMTFAYWDPSFLEQPRLLNSQTGEIEAVQVRPKGLDPIQVEGREVRAKRYALSTDELTIDLWYNEQLGWVGLSSDTGSGRRIIYKRI